MKNASPWRQFRSLQSPPSISELASPEFCYGPAETEFERVARSLHLTEKDWPKSEELKRWVARHKDQRYVPEDLLLIWKLKVRVSLGALEKGAAHA